MGKGTKYSYFLNTLSTESDVKDAVASIKAQYGINKIIVIDNLELLSNIAYLYIDDSIAINDMAKIVNKVASENIDIIPVKILHDKQLQSWKRYRKMRKSKSIT